MTEEFALRWTGPALEDLRSIRDHIVSEGKPNAAKRLAEKIRERVLSLPMYPHAGRGVPEFPRAGYREVIVAPYRIIYELTADQIVILRVWHGRRDLSRIEQRP